MAKSDTMTEITWNYAPRDEDVVVVESDAEITRVTPSVLCVGVVHAGVQDDVQMDLFRNPFFESPNNLTPTTRSNELAGISYSFHFFSMSVYVACFKGAFASSC